ncbi:MAG: hypothetical protein LBB21_02680 [Holosporaceae bacterium]|jgi:hypothetical protein|nr:hypothetical protein [Holosporaceae bacterium]
MSLYLKTCGISDRTIIEIPDIYVVFTKNVDEKVLLLSSKLCCRTVNLEAIFVDKDKNIKKICFSENFVSSPMVEMEESRFVVFQAEDDFFRWNRHDKLLLKSANKVDFFLDCKNKRWVRTFVEK